MFTNPFKKHDVSEFPNVVIPLAQAQRVNSLDSDKEKNDDSSRSSGDGVQSGSGMTIEALRAIVDSDVAAGGHDTAYDREFDLKLL
jgi:hypothetical protein